MREAGKVDPERREQNLRGAVGPSMDLNEYWTKRDFAATREPRGQATGEGGTRYVIQKHQATHLHYDLRLEMDGVLKSWAIPKMPPTTSGVRRLAVQVEDHPVDYATFEGVIPEGQYGAGTVEIWDHGTYTVKSKQADKLIFTINGHKLQGDYCLLRFKDKKNWLFFKKK